MRAFSLPRIQYLQYYFFPSFEANRDTIESRVVFGFSSTTSSTSSLTSSAFSITGATASWISSNVGSTFSS